jgi:hypothetical protein
MIFFKFITNTNKFNYQLLQLHTLIMHFDRFQKSFIYRSWDRTSRQPHLQPW